MSTRAGRDSNYMPIRLFKKLAVKRSGGLHVIAAVLSSESLSATERRKSKLRSYGYVVHRSTLLSSTKSFPSQLSFLKSSACIVLKHIRDLPSLSSRIAPSCRKTNHYHSSTSSLRVQ